MLFILQVSLAAIALIATPTEAAVASGEMNCRYSAFSSAKVNYYTCAELAEWYYITVEDFLKLNPGINKECSNIKSNTKYCVEGFVQPTLSTNGLCGPKNGNASCIEDDLACCNAETKKCGNGDSCLAGTCYSGACLGFPSEYSMDSNCGTQNKGLKCGGKWGSCCSTAGKCSNGEAFCGVSKCQSGNCTMIIPDWSETTTSKPVAVPTPTAGSISPDGSCAGANTFICKGSAFGDCCSSSGFCGTTTGHCTAGCQAGFGTCTSTDLSADGTCGGTKKYKCEGSGYGDCCSSSGFCGSSTVHCSAGCQSAFGTCTGSTSISPDGTCGGTNKFQCQDSGFGDCCSSSGYCGSTAGHCTAGCQTGFGTCTASDISPDGTCGGTNKYKCKGSSFGNCCSSAGYCGSTTSHCTSGWQSAFGDCSTVTSPVSTTNPVPTGVTTDGTCGGAKGLKCQGSKFGNCCSGGGYCGSTVAHCAQGCQKSFSNACLTSNVPTNNGECGSTNDGYTCAGGSFNGQCCSSGGFCGATDAHCKTGCQKNFGTCK